MSNENDRPRTPLNSPMRPPGAAPTPGTVAQKMVRVGEIEIPEVEADKIRADARATIQKEMEETARKELRTIALEEARAEIDPSARSSATDKEMVNITIDLAEHSDAIRLNGRPYFHGRTYAVARHVANTLRDIMFKGWEHQNQVDGKSLRNFYGKARSTVLSPVHGTVNAPRRADQ